MANTLLTGLPPTHPGEVLREDVLPAIGGTKAGLARTLGISRQTLYDLLEERQPVTPQMALRLGKLLGNAPEFWLRLQNAYDLATIAPKMAEQVDAITTLAAAA